MSLIQNIDLTNSVLDTIDIYMEAIKIKLFVFFQIKSPVTYN